MTELIQETVGDVTLAVNANGDVGELHATGVVCAPWRIYDDGDGYGSYANSLDELEAAIRLHRIWEARKHREEFKARINSQLDAILAEREARQSGDNNNRNDYLSDEDKAKSMQERIDWDTRWDEKIRGSDLAEREARQRFEEAQEDEKQSATHYAPDREFRVTEEGAVETRVWGTEWKQIVSRLGISCGPWEAQTMAEACRLRLEWEQRPRLPDGWCIDDRSVFVLGGIIVLFSDPDSVSVLSEATTERCAEIPQAQRYARWKAGQR